MNMRNNNIKPLRFQQLFLTPDIVEGSLMGKKAFDYNIQDILCHDVYSRPGLIITVIGSAGPFA